MGRIRKYHTPEEKAAVHRECNRKYHEKNKKKINRRRRKAYEKANLEVEPTHLPTNLHAEAEPAPKYWLDRVRVIPGRVQRYIKNTPIAFAETVCTSYINNGDVEGANQVITDHITSLNKIGTSLQKYQDKVLEAYGCGGEYKEGDGIRQRLTRLVHWLEEILVLALEDPVLVQARYRAKNFLFQKVSFRDVFSFEDARHT